jgi:protein-tyrosine-phosphatase
MGKEGEEVNREEEVEAEEKEINNKSNRSRTTDANAFDLILTIKRSSRLVLSQFIKLLSRDSEEVSSAMSRIVDSESLNTRTGTLIPAAATAAARGGVMVMAVMVMESIIRSPCVSGS